MSADEEEKEERGKNDYKKGELRGMINMKKWMYGTWSRRRAKALA
jgi:hypothetical protein